MLRCLPRNDNPNTPATSYPTDEHKGDCIVISSNIVQCISITANIPPCIDIIGIQGTCEECNLPLPQVSFNVQEEHYEGETYACTITNASEFPSGGTFYIFSGAYQGDLDLTGFDTFNWNMPNPRDNICIQIRYEGDGCVSDTFNLCTNCLPYENVWEINGERFGDNSDSFYSKFSNRPDIDTFKLIKLKSTITDITSAWYKCINMTSFECEVDTSSVTNMANAWWDCNSLTSFPAITTSSVTNMQGTWQNCNSLTSFPAIDTSSVTNMVAVWSHCTSLTSFPAIDTSSVTYMAYTWNHCTSLTLHEGVSDCSEVESSTFQYTQMCNGNAGDTDNDGNLLCPYENNKPCT